LCARYPALWEKIVAEWRSAGPADRAWLTYAANYLFRTGGVRWALDPLTFAWRLKGAAPEVEVAALGEAAFILLTHRHADHLDLDLLSALRSFPLCWVVPESLLPLVTGPGGLPREKILVPAPLQPLELPGVRITPFDGLHWQTGADGARQGVPALGYLAEFAGQRWLFPGDTRTYDASQLPDFGPLDGLVAHLWLGGGAARQEPPPLVDEFCRFCLDLRPGRVVLTHLQEFGRGADDFWDEAHLAAVQTKFQALAPALPVQAVFTGDSFGL
jgi:L-ascorbate metabolism protein UlaG (beta-lactamase superfamily)